MYYFNSNYKNKYFIVAILIFLLSLSAEGQTILKGKKLKNQLIKIDSLVQFKQYEKGINLFYNNENIIIKDNVPKKMKVIFDKLSVILNVKKDAFDKMKVEVENLQKEYELENYCYTIKLIDIELNNENSYIETQKIKNVLLNDLLAVKNKCNFYTNKIIEWEQLYKNQQYEPLYSLLNFDEQEKKYFYSNDLISFNDLIMNIKEAKANSDKVSEKIKLWKKMYDEQQYENLYPLLDLSENETKYIYQADAPVLDTLLSNIDTKLALYNETSDKIDELTSNYVNNLDFINLDISTAKSLDHILTNNLRIADSLIKQVPGQNPMLENFYKSQRESVVYALNIIYSFIKNYKSNPNNQISYTIPVLKIDDFSQVFYYFDLCNNLLSEDKPLAAERANNEACKILGTIFKCNKKFLIQYSAENDDISINVSMGEITFDGYVVDQYTGSKSRSLVLRFSRDFGISKYYTSDKIIEKLENLPRNNSENNSQSISDHSIVVQLTPNYWGRFGSDTKCYSCFSYDNNNFDIQIFIKIIEVN